jgi:hypothetical protein
LKVGGELHPSSSPLTKAFNHTHKIAAAEISSGRKELLKCKQCGVEMSKSWMLVALLVVAGSLTLQGAKAQDTPPFFHFGVIAADGSTVQVGQH